MICSSYSHLADLRMLVGAFLRAVPAVSLISVGTATVTETPPIQSHMHMSNRFVGVLILLRLRYVGAI